MKNLKITIEIPNSVDSLMNEIGFDTDEKKQKLLSAFFNNCMDDKYNGNPQPMFHGWIDESEEEIDDLLNEL